MVSSPDRLHRIALVLPWIPAHFLTCGNFLHIASPTPTSSVSRSRILSQASVLPPHPGLPGRLLSAPGLPGPSMFLLHILPACPSPIFQCNIFPPASSHRPLHLLSSHPLSMQLQSLDHLQIRLQYTAIIL